MKTLTQKDMHPYVHCSIIYNSQDMEKKLKCPSMNEWKNCGIDTQWNITWP